MAIVKSEWTKGRKQAPVSGEARNVVTERFDFTIGADMAANDIVELAVLPAYHFVVDAVLILSAGLGAGRTVDVGIMSGDVGEEDNTRTSGNELYAAQDSAAAVASRMVKADGFLLAPGNKDRSIGVKVSDTVTAANQKVTLVLQYAQ